MLQIVNYLYLANKILSLSLTNNQVTFLLILLLLYMYINQSLFTMQAAKTGKQNDSASPKAINWL